MRELKQIEDKIIEIFSDSQDIDFNKIRLNCLIGDIKDKLNRIKNSEFYDKASSLEFYLKNMYNSTDEYKVYSSIKPNYDIHTLDINNRLTNFRQATKSTETLKNWIKSNNHIIDLKSIKCLYLSDIINDKIDIKQKFETSYSEGKKIIENYVSEKQHDSNNLLYVTLMRPISELNYYDFIFDEDIDKSKPLLDYIFERMKESENDPLTWVTLLVNDIVEPNKPIGIFEIHYAKNGLGVKDFTLFMFENNPMRKDFSILYNEVKQLVGFLIKKNKIVQWGVANENKNAKSLYDKFIKELIDNNKYEIKTKVDDYNQTIYTIKNLELIG